MTLQRKLALGSALAVLISALGATALIVYTIRDVQNAQVNELMRARLVSVLPTEPIRTPDVFGNATSEVYLPQDLLGELNRTERTRGFSSANGPVLLVDMIISGQHVPAGGVTAVVGKTSIAPVGVVVFHDVDVDARGVNMVRVAQVAIDEGVALRVVRSIDDVQHTIQQIALSVILIGIGIALFSAAATALFVGRALRPLRELATTAGEAGRTQDLSLLYKPSEFDKRNRDEVAELGHSLSDMAGSVIESRQFQQRLVDDAAHELRTPLTSLRTNLQLLQQSIAQGRPLAADVVASALEDSLSESDELGSLVEELVALSAVAGPTLDPGSHQEINVGELVYSVVTRANRRSGREISLTVADKSATVFGNYSRLERAVTNIVNNAVKFAPMGRVDVSVLSNDAIDIIVEDAGPGIAPHDREHATDRFWRSTSARSLPGSGLGLSIVADIAKEFKGVVTIGESQSLGGARIGLHLPATTA